MKTAEQVELVTKYSAANYNPLPVVLAKGEGAWVWDIEGRKYLDCLSAYSALNQGHRHPRIIQALKDQADRITLTSRAFHNDQMGEFLKLVCEFSKMEMALPMNTGAEAVETAIKAARKWGYYKKGVPKDQAEIIVCRNNFHGRTTTIVGFSSEEQYRDGYGPFTPGFKLIDFGDAKQLAAAITPNTVAFLVEPIQGEAGVLVPPDGYLSEATKICRQNRVLLMLDEIQTGLGRTGKSFCYQHDKEAQPDILILGKALGGGVYPVSAIVASKEILGVFRPGDHGSTFGGNPLGSAAGIASLKVIIDEGLVENSAKMGALLVDALRKMNSQHVLEVRGKGLLVGIELKKASGPARPFCERLAALGVLAKDTHGSVIRIAPPLTVGKFEMDVLCGALQKVLTGA